MPRPRNDIDKQLGLVVKDLIEHNQSIADIGTIVGCLGNDSVKWLKDLKKECSSVDEFLEVARQRADIALVAAAVQAAVGYDYEEIDQKYVKVSRGYDSANHPIFEEMKGDKVVKTRHARKNDSLLKFILKNRLPEFFQDVQKVEINKKSIEIKEVTAKEIERFAGRLLDTVTKKETKD